MLWGQVWWQGQGPRFSSLVLQTACQRVRETFLLNALINLCMFLTSFPCAAVQEVAGEATVVSPCQKSARVEFCEPLYEGDGCCVVLHGHGIASLA